MEQIEARTQKYIEDALGGMFQITSSNINDKDECKRLEKVDVTDDETGYVTRNGYKTGSYGSGYKPGSYGIGIKSLTKGESWIVVGQWEFIINSVKETEERDEDSSENPEQVVYIDYSYKNLGYTGDSCDLWFAEANFTVIDEEGEVANEYSIFDENHLPREIPVGAKCSNAKVAFGLKNKSSQITIQVEENTSYSDLHEEKVNFVLQVER